MLKSGGKKYLTGLNRVKILISKKAILSGILLILITIFTLCENPSSVKQTIVIKTLVRGKLQTGKYSVFWDGKDESNKFVEPGTYLVWLYARTFTYEIRITALQGGVTGINDSTTAPVYGNWGLTELLQNHPEPFRIQSGTNIPFIIGEDVAGQTVEITVRKEKDE